MSEYNLSFADVLPILFSGGFVKAEHMKSGLYLGVYDFLVELQ